MNDRDGPLIPMPEPTPDALRAAVARNAPGRLPALTQHLFEATTNAQHTQTLAPLHAFVHSWAVFIAIERHPYRAARLHELERLVAAGNQDSAEAIAEIRAIRAAAEAEVGLAVPPHDCVQGSSFGSLSRAGDRLPAMVGLGSVTWPPAPIRTERLVLRESEARDRAAFIELFTSPAVGAYMGGPRPRDECERVLPETPERRPGLFVIELDGAMIGTIDHPPPPPWTWTASRTPFLPLVLLDPVELGGPARTQA